MKSIKHLQRIIQWIGLFAIGLLALFGLLTLIFQNYKPVSAALVSVEMLNTSAKSVQSAPVLQAVDATVPLYIKYQGYLTNEGGTPITTAYTMTFAIYADNTSTQALWTETLSKIKVSDGRFSVLLGGKMPIPPSLFEDPERYIGLTIHPNAEMKRQQLASVPYVVHAESASGVYNAEDSIVEVATRQGKLTIEPNDGRWTRFGTDQAGFRFDKGIAVDTGQIGSFNQDLQLQTNGNTHLTIQTNGEVGVGTVDPTARLHVVGDLKVDGTIINTAFPLQELQQRIEALKPTVTDLEIKLKTHIAGF